MWVLLVCDGADERAASDDELPGRAQGRVMDSMAGVGVATTHELTFGAGYVVKTYTRWDRNEAESEWRSLNLLHALLPGRVPRPLRAQLAAVPPSIRMSRIPGCAVDASNCTSGEVRALGRLVGDLLTAAPDAELERLPSRRWDAVEGIESLRAWQTTGVKAEENALVAEALASGRAWIETDLSVLCTVAQPAFSRGDGNVGNYLWDGQSMRAVDFEGAGASDLAFEIADGVEHISTWVVDSPLRALADHVNLDVDVDPDRLRDCRRLFAMFWMLMLMPDGPASSRNPVGTLDIAARRLLELL